MTEQYIMVAIQIVLMSILGLAVGEEYGAPFGFIALVALPLLVWIIREIKS